MNTFTPVDGSNLRKEENKDAITSLIFLAKEIYCRIKGRACAYGRGQRGKYEKEDAVSPTFEIESILITSDIDAHERRDVEAIDIPGAFLHSG